MGGDAADGARGKRANKVLLSQILTERAKAVAAHGARGAGNSYRINLGAAGRDGVCE